MAGDFSRESFRPGKRFAAVLMQQGRVQLDADWNEQAAILHRRMLVQARETFGRAAASRFGTQDAFHIAVIAGPPRDLSIQPGRYWVEGRLAEAFASDGNPPTYLRQPFLPAPPPLPAQGGAIVFLETWEREVTWVEDPSLLDVALGGVDTAARLQSIWQVRALARQDAACGLDLDAIFPASPARLTTAATAPPAPEDPCLVAPRTGYRGLENRLYRVEVHRGGNAATARFKWSRDNASIRSPILSMRREVRGAVEVTVLSVARIGRDPGLAVQAGDWIEVTDEHRFLDHEPGEMAQVAEPPLEQPGEDGVQVVLDRLIPAAGTRAFGTGVTELAARRTRLVRWDQAAPRNAVDADGLMAVGITTLGLEEGVEVRFTLAATNGQFRAGDYWTFAARTADASVEVLDTAPPHGPQRRFAMLASFAEVGRGDAPSDCRTLWPPLPQGSGEGCCTIILQPGQDLQAAVDRLGPAGGCICLKPGVHELRDTLRIRNGRISIHAEAPGAAMIRRAGALPLVAIGSNATSGLTVRDIHLAGIVFQLGSLRDSDGDGLGLLDIGEGAEAVEVTDCHFAVQDFAGGAAAIQIAGAGVAVRRCAVEGLRLGILLTGQARDVVVEDSAFAATGNEEAQQDPGLIAIHAEACNGTLRILRNAARFYRQGVVLGAPGGKGVSADLVAIDGNVILRTEPPDRAFEGAPVRDATPVREAPPIRGPALVRDTAPAASGLSAAAGIRLSAMRLLDRTGDTVGTHAETAATALPMPPSGLPLFAIEAAGRNVTITENLLAWNAPGYGGVLAGNGVRLVQGNDLLYRGSRTILQPGPNASGPSVVGAAAAEEEPTALVYGIASGLGALRGGGGLVVRDNAVQGALVAIAIGGGTAATVEGNLISRALAGILAARAEQPALSANILVAVLSGISLINCAAPQVDGNLVLASENEAIQIISTGSNLHGGLARITGNRLLNSGHGEKESASAITALLVERVEDKDAATVTPIDILVDGNDIADTGVPPGNGARAPRSIGIAIAAPRATVQDNDVRWDTPALNEGGQKLLEEEGAKPNRALVVTALPAEGVEAGRPFADSLVIHGNRFRGFAVDTLVEVAKTTAERSPLFLSILFGDNAIQHWAARNSDGNAPSVILRAAPQAAIAIAGNTIRGPGRRPSIGVEGPKEVAFAGNATTGPLVGAQERVNVLL